jgi:type IV pilus assembly protein PilC
MAEWAWEARTKAGEIRKGIIEADDDKAVFSKLRIQQLIPIRVKKKGTIDLSFIAGMFTGVTDKDLVIFTRQFATIIDAGLPLVTGLEILSTQMDNKNFRKVLAEVKTEVESGATLSDALRRFPKVFDDLYVNMVAAGEAGGILDTILNRLAIHIEKRAKIKGQVKGALTYPVVVMIIGIMATTVMLWKVIPTFANMFSQMGGGTESLPAATKFVINISDNFMKVAPWIALVAVILGVAYYSFYRLPQGKLTVHRFFLLLPVIGTVIKKTAVARFTRTLGTMLSSGVPILEALEIVSRAVGNAVIEKAVLYARDRISEGKTMAEPLGQAKVFPGMVVQMISVGEQSGSLDQMCNKIADFYEEEVDVAIAALTSMLEPFIMIFIGGMVGGLLIAMYLPIFTLAGQVRE